LKVMTHGHEPAEPMHASDQAHGDVTRGDARAVLLYDRDCRFCRFSLARVLGWDRRGRLRPLALQEPEAQRLLAGIEEQRRMGSWHLIELNGELSSAGSALPPLLRMLPGGRPLAALAELSPGLTETAYDFVARNRSKFSRVVGIWWEG
jgi:predicted DCC family thiol-disulfide oxidoreductase YuxK